MKNIIIFCFACLCCKLHAQTIEAHYKVVQKMASGRNFVVNKGGNGENLLSKSNNNTNRDEFPDLEFEGLIYKSGNKTIAYMVPQFLSQYPRGMIQGKSENGSNSFLAISRDTVQMPFLYQVNDSLITAWCGTNASPHSRRFTKSNYKIGAMKWVETGEKKKINGYDCVNMRAFTASQFPVFDGWVCKTIPAGFAFFSMRDVPGIIVEGYMPRLNASFKLVSVKLHQPIPESVFWPDIFKNAKFEDKTVPANPKEQEKENKRKDIMNQ